MTRLSNAAMLGLLALGIAACAAHSPWTNPRLSPKQWDYDWDRCKAKADHLMPHNAADWDDSRQDPLAEANRLEAKKDVDGAVAACMAGLGYSLRRNGQ